MKKLWPLILTMVMVIASCDKYSEGEYEPIYVHDISVNGNSVTIRANVNETYLNLYGFEVGAVCGTSSDVFRGQYDAIHADVSHYNERGGYLFELYDLPSGACYIRPYVYNEQNGTGKYNEAIRVEISGIADPVDEAGFRDLSYHESANCYIVSQEGRYKFKAVKGNSDERLDVYSADVLWESFGTDIAPSAGDLIPYVEYADFNQDGYFEIHFVATDLKGNAVIAARNMSGEIVWSWHVWMTDQPHEQVYYNDAGTMMDRNLGATSATPGDVGALGLLYQWGRKDPFLGSSSISLSVEAVATQMWPSPEWSDPYFGRIEYTIANPMTCIITDSDWLYMEDGMIDHSRWFVNKTIYDPCPKGWRIPDGYEDGIWNKAIDISIRRATYDFINCGMNLSGIYGEDSMIWYPTAGLRSREYGDLSYIGQDGRYWSCGMTEPVVNGVHYDFAMLITRDGRVEPALSHGPWLHGDAYSVRCQKDQGETSGSEESVSWILHGSNGDITMTKDGDRYVANDVLFPDPTVASNGRPDNKFQIHNSLGTSYGAEKSMTVITPGEVLQLTEGYNSIYIEQGVYDIWFHPGNLTVEVVRLDDKYTVFDESANCYIVSESGAYKFRSVQGNSGASVGDVAYAEVLWESFGTDVTPNVGDLIKSVSYKDGEIAFQTADSFKEGNAVIAAKDVSGTILWSWHIWLTDQPQECVYANNAGTMMDRNLGATSATPGDVGALGLLYQWGRKDPFLGSSSISDNVDAQSTISWPSAIASDASSGTIAYTIENPTTFITSSSNNLDWYYTGDTTTDDTRWQSEKTIYDPCPAGWRVPDGGSNGVWALAGFKGYSYDTSTQGMLLDSGVSSPATWYPEAGRRTINGVITVVGTSGYFWSGSPQGNLAHHLILSNGKVTPNSDNHRVFGESVRCLKEGTGGGTPEPEVPAINLSESGTANAYIVSKKGAYKFSSVKGNSVTSVGTVASAEVLWESFGTDVAPNVGDLIKSVSYMDGEITFQTADTFKEGNAVIAAKDVSGTILWSWHIWLTDQPQECVYANNAGTMMDRNLGATSATPGDVGALGLLYQWGRKDPFLGSSSISSSVDAQSTISWPSAIASDASNGTISYATEHPTTFITYNGSNRDWYYTGNSNTDDTRWQSEKTIYDPCPAGWRVPDGGSDGVWAKAGFYDLPYDGLNNNGVLFGEDISVPSTWYPAAGYRALFGRGVDYVGTTGYYWSVTITSNYAYNFNYIGGYRTPKDSKFSRGDAQSVRCIKE